MWTKVDANDENNTLTGSWLQKLHKGIDGAHGNRLRWILIVALLARFWIGKPPQM